MVALIILFPSLVTTGLDPKIDSGQPVPVQLLAPMNPQNATPADSNQNDAADLLRRLPQSEQ